MEPRWLSVDEVMFAHSETVAEFGGTAELRDRGLLESALDRPRNLHAYGDNPTMYAMAAAYCAGIVKNHPFVDGNKRAGVLAAAIFLDLNGYEFQPDEAEAYVIFMALAAGEVDDEALAAWISDNSTPRQD